MSGAEAERRDGLHMLAAVGLQLELNLWGGLEQNLTSRHDDGVLCEFKRVRSSEYYLGKVS